MSRKWDRIITSTMVAVFLAVAIPRFVDWYRPRPEWCDPVDPARAARGRRGRRLRVVGHPCVRDRAAGISEAPAAADRAARQHHSEHDDCRTDRGRRRARDRESLDRAAALLDRRRAL